MAINPPWLPAFLEFKMSPWKILYLIDTLEIGGAERSLLDIARRLDRKQFAPLVCSIYKGATLQPEFERAGVPVVPLGLDGKYQFPRAYRRLKKLIRQERPDLVHTTLFRADQIGRAAAKWTGTPVVSSFVNTSYDPVRLVDNPHLSRWKLNALKLMDRVSSRWVTRFHAVAASVRDNNCRHLRIDPRRVDVVYRGRRTGDFEPQNDGTAERLRDQLLPKGVCPVLLNVGRLIDQKGQQYLLRAMPKVLVHCPNAHLAIAGDGWLRSDLETLAQRLDVTEHVSFLGSRDDVPDLLRAADIFVFPSLFEGLPGALVEAMLAGKAIVASDIPVAREMIQHETNGILVPQMTIASLADAIVQLNNAPLYAKRLGEQAQLFARERFDIELVVDQMHAFYQRVLYGEKSL